MTSERSSEYLIRKGGAYYRPNAQGYTLNKEEAGRFTLDEAIRHSHPNGPNGPRDGITYEPAPLRLTAQSGEGRSGAGEDALREAVRRFLPTNINLDAVHLPDEATIPLDVTMGELRGLRAALNARQSGEGEREEKAIARFADAIGRLPFVSEALAKGYQFNAYESASNDNDAEDDEREYQICIGPVSDVRFLFAVEGMAKADLIEAALKIAAIRATDAGGIN